jgi:hypothetical protein
MSRPALSAQNRLNPEAVATSLAPGAACPPLVEAVPRCTPGGRQSLPELFWEFGIGGTHLGCSRATDAEGNAFGGAPALRQKSASQRPCSDPSSR